MTENDNELLGEFTRVLDKKIEGINQTSKIEIQKTIKEEFNSALVMLGIEATNPMAVQRDMQFVRAHRIESEDTKKQLRTRVLNHTMTFVLFIMGLGLYEFLSHKILGP